jgi:hypothetical protein
MPFSVKKARFLIFLLKQLGEEKRRRKGRRP